MPKRRSTKKIAPRRTTAGKRDYRAWRSCLSAALFAGVIALALVARGVFAQVWSEPTLPPPDANAPAPIWNIGVSATAQSPGSFHIAGSGRIDTQLGINVDPSAACSGYALCNNSAMANGIKGSSSAGYGIYGDSTSLIGVFGQTGLATGAGVYGNNTSAAATAIGVQGVSANGYGVYGSSAGFAGYFSGKLTVTGEVGIGTTTPSAKLQVNNGPMWSSYNEGANIVISGSRNNAIGFLDASGANPWAMSAATDNSFNFYTMPVLGNTTTPPTLIMTLTGAGNVGIGTTTLGHKLEVSGTLNASSDITQNGVKVCLADGTNCPSFTSTAPIPVIYISSGSCPSGYATGSVQDGIANWGNSANSINYGFKVGTTTYYISAGSWVAGTSGVSGNVCVSNSAPVRYISSGSCPSGYATGSVQDGIANWGNSANSNNYGFKVGTTTYYISGGTWTTGTSGVSGNVCLKE